MALADTAQLIVQLKLDDKMTPGVNKVQQSLSRLQAGGMQVGQGLRQVGAGLARVGTIAAGAAAGGIAAAVKLAGDFEAQLNTINTIAKLNEQDLKGVGEGIRETFRATGAPLNDLTAAYYDLLSAGVKVKDAQQELNTAVKLGIGGLGSTAEAVDLLTTAQNAYGLSAEGVTKASDSFAAAVRDGKVKISEIASEFAVVAPLASNMGVSIDEINATLAFMTAKGNTAGQSLTAMRSAMIALQRQTPEMKTVLHDLGIENVQAEVKANGLQETFARIAKRADELGIPIIKLTGRVEGMNYVLATTGKNGDGFVAEMEKIRAATGETEAQFSERQKGLNFQLARLTALAKDAGITIGNALLPKLIPMIEKLNTFIGKHQKDIANFGEELADGFERFSKAIPGIVSGLGILARVGQKAVDIFLALPPGLQSALVAGFAINKLSGGLIGSGLGNIAGGAIKIGFELFRNRGQTPLNPLFVQQVGPGGVPGVGGPGGLLGKLPLIGGGAALAVGLTAASIAALGVAFVASQQVRQDPFSHPGDVISPGRGFGPMDLHGPRGAPRGGASTPLGQFAAGNQGGVPVHVNNAGDIVPKSLFERLGHEIRVAEKATRGALKEGDIHQARLLSNDVQALHALQGTVRKGYNDIVPKLGETNRALSVANRNLQDGNKRQRETAQGIREARDRIGSGFQRSNELQAGILRKPSQFTANVTNNITATLSTYQSLQTMTRLNTIRTGFAPGDSTGGSI